MTRSPDGSVPRCEGQLVFYVHLATPGMLTLHLHRSPNAPAMRLRTTLTPHPGDGGPQTETETETDLRANHDHDQELIDLGQLGTTTPGYHRITLETTDSSPLLALHSLELSGPAATGARASTVERRNASSVHLGYDVPPAHRDDIEWFYCEITPRTDPLWTYYMATGWHRGYFGMQVNSPTERRLIFSVWDAGDEAKDRDKVADDDRVQLVAKGEGVHVDGFGNEGTGGHSHLVHDWNVGDTFRFLVHARPDGTHTTYTGWFWFAETREWRLIASFRAPKDGGRLRGLYSFNENFSGANGDLRRDCEFGNVWARTHTGEWLPLRSARFTHDGHGSSERLDRSGGVRGARFYLRNGGFDAASTRAGTRMQIQAAPGTPPAVEEMPTPPAAGTASKR
ncbi:MAG TPA: DUF3472 domain-containing protein [Planctomycetota bacterium]|nr:DUF3472 domain-containing protein [Planctomycetota bacterium]